MWIESESGYEKGNVTRNVKGNVKGSVNEIEIESDVFGNSCFY